MHRFPALLLASALLLPGCKSLEQLEVQGFRRSVRISQPVPLQVAILIPEDVQHLTVPPGSLRLNTVAIGEGLFDASIDYFGQVFEDAFVVYTLDDPRVRDVVIVPSIVSCRPQYEWGFFAGHEYVCDIVLRMEVLVDFEPVWDVQYVGEGTADVSMSPFHGLREIENACRRSVGAALRQVFNSAAEDLIEKPPLVLAFHDVVRRAN